MCVLNTQRNTYELKREKEKEENDNLTFDKLKQNILCMMMNLGTRKKLLLKFYNKAWHDEIIAFDYKIEIVLHVIKYTVSHIHT